MLTVALQHCMLALPLHLCKEVISCRSQHETFSRLQGGLACMLSPRAARVAGCRHNSRLFKCGVLLVCRMVPTAAAVYRKQLAMGT